MDYFFKPPSLALQPSPLWDFFWRQKWNFFDQRVKPLSWLDLTESQKTQHGSNLSVTRKPHAYHAFSSILLSTFHSSDPGALSTIRCTSSQLPKSFFYYGRENTKHLLVSAEPCRIYTKKGDRERWERRPDGVYRASFEDSGLLEWSHHHHLASTHHHAEIGWLT